MSRQPCKSSGIATTLGFTLIELIVTIAVAAILLTIAVPSFTRLSTKTNTAQASNDLVGALTLARSEAASRGRVVCVDANANGWVDGWDVKVDMDSDRKCDATGDTVVRSYDKLGSRFTLSSAATEIAFNPAGALVGGIDATVQVCRTGASKAQAVVVIVRSSGTLSSYRDASVTGATCGS